ncbi:ABC transporter permease [Bradyrhizobium sp. CCGUVB4N]|uniref:ABC transporter permease n=1 Tax=Bradyrhizobium sp. CCGUVB4N TaxID=2949631 RepID=UPI0020B332D4|nr:ABC transporter permease [Bradyrhizobium sp. CCGUVB4N]MCP3380357.1 ABC transporter permease [Bradyrhizobium sp. CCGUVB4N]
MDSSTAESKDRKRSGLLLLAPASLVLIVFLLIPAGIVLRISFYPGSTSIGAEGYSLAQYVKFFSNSLYLSVLGETIAYALIVCLGCLVLGFPVGYSLARHSPAKRRLRMLMVIVPLTLSLVVVVFGWMVLLGRQGLVNSIMVSLGIVSTPQQLLFNRTAVVIVLIQQFLPFMILSVMNVVMQIDPILEQASTSLRANRARTFIKVIIPLSTPGILAGLSLIFVMAVSAFVTPRLVGGPRAQMVGGFIYDQILTTANWPFGGAMAFILLAIAFGLMAVLNAVIIRPLTRGLHVR